MKTLMKKNLSIKLLNCFLQIRKCKQLKAFFISSKISSHSTKDAEKISQVTTYINSRNLHQRLFQIQFYGIPFTSRWHFTNCTKECYFLLIFIKYESCYIAYIILSQSDSQVKEFAATNPYKSSAFFQQKSW